VIVAVAVVLAAGLLTAAAGDTLPARLSAEEFWGLVEKLSEPNGAFLFENFVSNEITFQRVVPELKRTVKPARAYIGVGPEQNFTYIAAVQPKIAFIVDIRRQNMLEQLLYKAVFELASDRADFIARLFSRHRPPGLNAATPSQQLFAAYKFYLPDAAVFDRTRREVHARLLTTHHLPLSESDQQGIDTVLRTFREGGPSINYAFDAKTPGLNSNHTYAALMTAADDEGTQWSFLASEANFKRVQDLQRRNLIVPVVGDFAGDKALPSVARYLKEHELRVSAFYVSNVEGYLFNPQRSYQRFYAHLELLPTDSRSTLIRSYQIVARRTLRPELAIVLDPIQDFVRAVKEGNIASYRDVIGRPE